MNLYKKTGGSNGVPAALPPLAEQQLPMRQSFFDSTSLLNANAMPNVMSEFRFRRPQPQGGPAVEPVLPRPQLKILHNQQKLAANGHTRVGSSTSSITSMSSSSSFCDDTNSKSGPHSFGDRTQFADLEHDILENWLEVEFQRQFKRLNGLIRNCAGSGSSLNNANTENESEILFFKRKSDLAKTNFRASHHDSLRNSPNCVISSSPLNGSDGHSADMCQANASQLTSWLMARRASGASQENQRKCLKSQTIHEEQTFDPVMLRPKLAKIPVTHEAQGTWVTARLSQIEQLLVSDCKQFPESTQNLICLALTEPNDKANRDTLLYAFPEPEPSLLPTFPSSVIKLGGMFITLSEVIDILRYSKLNPHPNSPLQTCRLQVIPGSGTNQVNCTDLSQQPPLPSRTYLFTILRHRFSPESLMSIDPKFAKAKKPPTIHLLVGLPIESGFTEADSKCLATLVESSIRHRFGSIQTAFESYFRSSASSHVTANFLNRTCSLFESLISPENGNHSLEAILTLTNTYFTSTPQTGILFPLRHLPSDDSVTMQSSKLLNYYDSLDWLDEAIARFYRRDSMGLEDALSEHFARCLQWSPESSMQLKKPSTNSAKMSTSIMGGAEDSNNNNGQPHLFDLLEMELSSFVVVGSAMFFRGLLVQSNLAHSYLNEAYKKLWSRGFLTLTKYQQYDLVYFTKCEDVDLKNHGSYPKTNHFLLVLGYGHLLHCSLLQVYCFDRSTPQPNADSFINSLGPNGTVINHSTLPGSLPSSFAFYVFIKESFRFLHYHLNSMAGNFQPDQIESLLEHSLENVYKLGLQVSAENFSLISTRDKKSRKAIEKMMKKTAKSKSPDETDKRKSASLLLDLSKSLNAKSPSHLDSPVSILKHSHPQAHSMPTTPAKSVRPQSMYSNWSCNSNLTTGNSMSSASSVTSLGSDCNCPESTHRASFDMNSLQSSVTSKSTASRATAASDLLFGSIYRFSHRHLPESLIIYLNVEPAQQLEGFYGPILDGQYSALEQDFDFPNRQQIITSITAELVHEIRQFQSSLRKLAELDLKRQKGKPISSQFFSPISSGTIISTHYDLITSKRIPAHDLSSQSLTVSFKFYLLGRCARLDANQAVDEFYACFKLNSKNTELVSELTSKSSRSKWSLGRFSLKLDNFSENSPKKRGSSYFGFSDRSNDYELNRMDYLRGDFEELVQAVRLGSANWH